MSKRRQVENKKSGQYVHTRDRSEPESLSSECEVGQVSMLKTKKSNPVDVGWRISYNTASKRFKAGGEGNRALRKLKIMC